MKNLIIVLLISCHFFSYGQDTTPLHSDSLLMKGILLDKGWKFNTGDNPEWAKPNFNDEAWQSIDPTLDVHQSLPQIPQSGISWFRIHLPVGNEIQKKQLALIIQQSGASQIYLNGLLIQQFGKLDTDPKKVKAYDPITKPLLLPVNADTQQVLAVRFALQPGVHYTTMFTSTNPALRMIVKNAEKTLDDYNDNAFVMDTYKGFITGLYFLLLLIHFAYYFFQPAHKANLYFGLYALFYLLFIVCPVLSDDHVVALKYYSFSLALLFSQISILLLLTAIYQLLDEKKDWIYWSILLLAIPSFLISLWQYGWGWHFGADFMTILIQVNIARVTLKGVQRKKKGAWLIAGGAVCCLLLFVLFVLTLSLRPDLPMLANMFYAFAGLSIPITTSIYLGLDFGFVSATLKQKLNEVNELSQKNIEQEREKQQILSAQNITLEKQVSERTVELSKSLKELKETQSQLIQSEKMASLGALTAGIAHEIQNPLNFVNNFSEVNRELVEEMKTELKAGNNEEAILIANDIADNEEKINHHGKRADAIVKGMLQHSQSSSGVKEPTDINKLVGDYLRLCYQGFVTKDKTLPAVQAGFTTEIKTDFDETMGNINIIPQDIGRVLLNLYNNAFYAVQQKQKEGPRQEVTPFEKVSPLYEPTVSVSTKKNGDKVLVSVKDNANGIPQKIVNKIFQPFFTTKPTGQGTGLGLSLAYDIIKAHGGEIRVDTKEGEGSEFTIQLPIV
jgi:two-component system, NtrC family, sensor kinase